MISLEEIEYAHSEKFGDNANMISKIETILQMNAFSCKSVILVLKGATSNCWDHFEIMWIVLVTQSYLRHDTFELLVSLLQHSTAVPDDRSIVLLFRRFLDLGDE